MCIRDRNNTYSEKAENISNKESMGEMTENSEHGIEAVSYTHLDVYKRQRENR